MLLYMQARATEFTPGGVGPERPGPHYPAGDHQSLCGYGCPTCHDSDRSGPSDGVGRRGSAELCRDGVRFSVEES